jgi:hypothetical protein
MTYYYGPRRRRRYGRPNTALLSDSTTQGHSKSFNVEAYLKNEFFTADTATLTKIIGLYRHLYGDGPYRYLLQTYSGWKTGSVRVSRQTSVRILQCVPKFLTDEKRFYILKCEIIHFIDRLHLKQQNKTTSLAQLNARFQSYVAEIDKFAEINLPWFLKDGIFDESEIQQLLAACKYALIEKLRQSYHQVQSDLELIRDRLNTMKPGTFSASYRIDFLNSTIDLSRINQQAVIESIDVRPAVVNLSGRFKSFAESYILDELVKMRFSERQGQINRLIKAQDIDFFLGQYRELLNRDEEVLLNSTFQGEGGQLTLSLSAKSMRLVHAQILASSVRLGLYVALLLTAIAIVVHFKLYAIVCGLFYITLLVAGAILGAIHSEVKALRSLKEDWKKHG